MRAGRGCGTFSRMTLTRRRMLAATGAAVGGLALTAPLSAAGAAASAPAQPLPAPGRSGIDHIVVVMMENRSFDHFLGWLPGADGRQAGLRFVDRYGRPAHARGTCTTSRAAATPTPTTPTRAAGSSSTTGACDGWLRAGENDAFAIGYYTAADLAFWRQAAPTGRSATATSRRSWPRPTRTASTSTPAQTDRLHNSDGRPATLPTIWDRLAAAGPHRPLLLLRRPVHRALGHEVPRRSPHRSRSSSPTARAGTLPDVSFVDPRFDGRGLRDLGRRPPARRHPRRRALPGHDLQRRRSRARPGSGRCWSSTTTSGAASSTTSPPRTAPDADPATALRGFRVPALVDLAAGASRGASRTTSTTTPRCSR